MRTLILFFSLIILGFGSFAQKSKNNLSFNTGLQYCSNFNKNSFITTFYGCVVGDVLKRDVRQKSTVVFDANLIKILHTGNKKRYAVVGLSFNQIGFEEFGFKGNWDEPEENYLPYKQICKISYAGLIIGPSFVLNSSKKFAVELFGYLNPERKLERVFPDIESSRFRKYIINGRIGINAEYRLNQNYSLNLSPFFQSSLCRYNKTANSEKGNYYRPYTFGITLGFGF